MRIVRLFDMLPLRLTILLVAGISLSGPAALARVCGNGFGADGNDAALVETPPLTAVVVVPVLASAASLGAADTIQQSSNGDQSTANTGAGAKPASSDNKDKKLTVNPVTGLVTTTASDYQPLTDEERWKLYWKMNYFSIGSYFGPFFDALLLDQATGSPAQWGGGFAGYGRRVASRTASAILQGTIQAPAAALLHEDVRYIASTQHGFKRRAVHALAYSFLTYNDQGHPTLNIANLGAYYAATAASTLWLPGQHNITAYTVSNSSEQIALTLPVNLLQEFWPEVRRYVLHRR